MITKSAHSLSSSISSRLSRRTSSGSFIPEIDGLRFVAIMAVVLYHIRGYLVEKTNLAYSANPDVSFVFRQLSYGHYGVELFFVLSGFILAVPFLSYHLLNGRRVSLKKYFVRRLTRLEPPYIINMVMLFLLLIIVKGDSIATLLPSLLASLGYQHNVVFGLPSLINSVAWSLEIEVQFYLMVPVLSLMFLIKKRIARRFTLIGVSLLSIIARMTILPTSGNFDVTLAHYLQYFLMGFLLADFYLVDWQSHPSRHYKWDVIGLLAWVSLSIVVHYHSVALVLFPVLTLVGYMSAFRGKVFHWIFSRRFLTVTGGMCYTIYLFHYQIISAVGRFSLGFGASDVFWKHFAIQSIVIIPVILFVSSLFFLMFEKPFMNPYWFNQLISYLKGKERDERSSELLVQTNNVTPREEEIASH